MPTYIQTEPKKQVVYFVEPDIYEVEIRNAVEKKSQTGNDMIKLEVGVVLPDGTEGPEVWDFLVFTPKAAWKIDAFRSSTGEAIVAGEPASVEASDLIGRKGVALIGEEEKGEHDHRFNKLERWIHGDEKTRWLKAKAEGKHVKAKGNAYAPAEAEEDDIPF